MAGIGLAGSATLSRAAAPVPEFCATQSFCASEVSLVSTTAGHPSQSTRLAAFGLTMFCFWEASCGKWPVLRWDRRATDAWDIVL